MLRRILDILLTGIVLLATGLVVWAVLLYLGGCAFKLAPGEIETIAAAVVQQQETTAGRDAYSFDPATLRILAGGLVFALLGAVLFYPLVWRPLASKRRKEQWQRDVAYCVSEAVTAKLARHPEQASATAG